MNKLLFGLSRVVPSSDNLDGIGFTDEHSEVVDALGDSDKSEESGSDDDDNKTNSDDNENMS